MKKSKINSNEKDYSIKLLIEKEKLLIRLK